MSLQWTHHVATTKRLLRSGSPRTTASTSGSWIETCVDHRPRGRWSAYYIADPYAVLDRPVNVWLFVYTIGLTPMILGCAYLVSQRRHADESAAALSLAATLLSLLAIRQVVTPAEIHGPTRLDRLLGLELVLLVVLFTWKATSGPRSRWSRDLSRLRRSAGWGDAATHRK